MDSGPDLARIASTVGDPRRIHMLSLLMEGRALTAKELALGAGIEPATATAHLKRLLDDGLLESASQGRHKYFRFASEHVAHLVESLMRVAPRRQAAPRRHSGWRWPIPSIENDWFMEQIKSFDFPRPRGRP